MILKIFPLEFVFNLMISNLHFTEKTFYKKNGSFLNHFNPILKICKKDKSSYSSVHPILIDSFGLYHWPLYRHGQADGSTQVPFK